MSYNATAYKKREDGSVFSVEAVEIDGDGRVIRACGLWSPWNGTERFEEIWEAAQFNEVAEIHIEQDGAAGYRNRISALGMVPA
jgi:hypothetical protein